MKRVRLATVGDGRQNATHVPDNFAKSEAHVTRYREVQRSRGGNERKKYGELLERILEEEKKGK